LTCIQILPNFLEKLWIAYVFKFLPDIAKGSTEMEKYLLYTVPMALRTKGGMIYYKHTTPAAFKSTKSILNG